MLQWKNSKKYRKRQNNMSKHYRLINKDGHAKRGEFTTVHGVIQTPVFMNVGTAACHKRGGIHHGSAADKDSGGVV